MAPRVIHPLTLAQDFPTHRLFSVCEVCSELLKTEWHSSCSLPSALFFVCQVLEPFFQITVAFPGSPTREGCWDRLNSGCLTCGCSLLSDTASSAPDNMFPVTIIIVFRAILNDKWYSCPLQVCKPEESLFGQNIYLGLRLMSLFLENCHSLLFFGWGFPPLHPHPLPGSYK